MEMRSRALLLAATGATGLIALTGCSGATSGSPNSPASSSAVLTPPAGFATTSPQTVPPPSEVNGVQALTVQLSSQTTSANQQVEVVVTGPSALQSKSVYIVSPTSGSTLEVLSTATSFDEAGHAGININTDKTITLRAVVPVTDAPDSGNLSTEDPLLATSAEFTITVS